MKINAVSIRPGHIIQHQNRLWRATKIQHTQPGKGGAYMQVELKDIRDGTKMNERFRSSETVEKVHLEQKDYQFLYAEGDLYCFMDQESYEQVSLHKDMIGEDQLPYLTEGLVVQIEFFEASPISVQLPETVVVRVEQADPVVKGQTASSSYKSAILENGIRIQVPPHIATGDRLVVNTVDSTYVERAKG